MWQRASNKNLKNSAGFSHIKFITILINETIINFIINSIDVKLL